MLSGDLSTDAPGVCSSLSRAKIPEPVVSSIKAAYKKVWQTEDLSELQTSLRTPGTSFNPRPARLMVIALKELQSPTPDPRLIPLLETLAENPKQTSANLSPLELAIVLIDDFRHAHLSPTASACVPQIDPSLINSIPDRLAAVLKTAHANALMLRDAKR